MFELSPMIPAAGFVLTLVLQGVSYGWLKKQASDAEKKAEAAQDKADAAKLSLAAFREEAARRFVTDDMLKNVEERIVQSIERLGDRLDRVFDRFVPKA